MKIYVIENVVQMGATLSKEKAIEKMKEYNKKADNKDWCRVTEYEICEDSFTEFE